MRRALLRNGRFQAWNWPFALHMTPLQALAIGPSHYPTMPPGPRESPSGSGGLFLSWLKGSEGSEGSLVATLLQPVAHVKNTKAAAICRKKRALSNVSVREVSFCAPESCSYSSNSDQCSARLESEAVSQRWPRK
jgi:hypothetical protein